jgi:hypothetical protein
MEESEEKSKKEQKKADKYKSFEDFKRKISSRMFELDLYISCVNTLVIRLSNR